MAVRRSRLLHGSAINGGIGGSRAQLSHLLVVLRSRHPSVAPRVMTGYRVETAEMSFSGIAGFACVGPTRRGSFRGRGSASPAPAISHRPHQELTANGTAPAGRAGRP